MKPITEAIKFIEAGGYTTIQKLRGDNYKITHDYSPFNKPSYEIETDEAGVIEYFQFLSGLEKEFDGEPAT